MELNSDRRKLSIHEIFRDCVSVGTLLTLLTTAALLGAWVGKNDERWRGQEETNITTKTDILNVSNKVSRLIEIQVARTQRPFNDGQNSN